MNEQAITTHGPKSTLIDRTEAAQVVARTLRRRPDLELNGSLPQHPGSGVASNSHSPDSIVRDAIIKASTDGINTQLLAGLLRNLETKKIEEKGSSEGANTADVAKELIQDFMKRNPGFDQKEIAQAVEEASLTVDSAHRGFLAAHNLPAHLDPEQAAQRVRLDIQILKTKDARLEEVRAGLAKHKRGDTVKHEPKEIINLKDLELTDFTSYQSNFFHNLKVGVAVAVIALPLTFLMAIEARILGRFFPVALAVIGGAVAFNVKKGFIPWFKPTHQPDPDTLNTPLYNRTKQEIEEIGFQARHQLTQQKDGRWSLSVYACLPTSEGI